MNEEEAMHFQEQDQVKEKDQYSTSKFLLKSLHRESRVDQEKYQAMIPILEYSTQEEHTQIVEEHKKIFTLEKINIYKQSQLPPEIIEEFLNFAKQLVREQNEGLLIGSGSVFDVEEKSLNFLKSMNYSVTKAKFYLLFPTLRYFNNYKPQSKIELTEEEMDKKINLYIQQLHETKITQNEKWRQDILEMLQERVHINKLQSHIEQGRSMKYELPENAKEVIEKALLSQKKLKKLMSEKSSIESLEKTLETVQKENQIITTEEVNFQQLLDRSQKWIEKIQQLFDFFNSNQLIQYKLLQSLIQEYRNLPILHQKFEDTFKNMYEQATDMIEKIPVLSKVLKTRGAVGSEKVSITEGFKKTEKIQKMRVTCDEFESYIESFQSCLTEIENLQMYLQDDNEQKNIYKLNNILNSISEKPFYCKIQDYLKGQCEYFSLIEKIKKAQSQQKPQEVLDLVREAKKKGLISPELEEEEKKANQKLSWYQFFEQLNIERPFYGFAESYKEINLQPSLVEERKLVQMEQDGQKINIDNKDIEALSLKKEKIFKWKQDVKIKVEISFEEIHQLMNEGIQLNVDFSELRQTVQLWRKAIDWSIEVHFFIKQYDSNWICSFFKEEFHKILFNKYMEKHKCSPDKPLKMLLNIKNLPKFCQTSLEYKKLSSLFKCADDWNNRIEDLLETQSIWDQVETVTELQKQAENIPTNKELFDLIGNINKVFHWVSKVQETFSKLDTDNEILKRINEDGMPSLVNAMELFEFKVNNSNEDLKELCRQFWHENQKQIYLFLNIFEEIDIKKCAKIKQQNLIKLDQDFLQINKLFLDQKQKIIQIIEKKTNSINNNIGNNSNNTNSSNLNSENPQLIEQKKLVHLIELTVDWIKNNLNQYNRLQELVFLTEEWIEKSKELIVFDKKKKRVLKKNINNINNNTNQNLTIQQAIKKFSISNNLNEEISYNQNHELNIISNQQNFEQNNESQQINEGFNNENNLQNYSTNHNEFQQNENNKNIQQNNQQQINDISQINIQNISNLDNGNMQMEEQLQNKEINLFNQQFNQNPSDKKANDQMEIEQSEQIHIDNLLLQKDQLEQDQLEAKQRTYSFDSENNSNKENFSQHEQQEFHQYHGGQTNQLTKYHKNAQFFYLKLPQSIIFLYKAIYRGIIVDEVQNVKDYLQEINRIYRRAKELLNQKPKYQELKDFLQKTSKVSFYLLEISLLKKLCKWADSWTEIANAIIESQIKIKQSNKISSVQAILPADLNITDYLYEFDKVNFILKIKNISSKKEEEDDNNNNNNRANNNLNTNEQNSQLLNTTNQNISNKQTPEKEAPAINARMRKKKIKNDEDNNFSSKILKESVDKQNQNEEKIEDLDIIKSEEDSQNGSENNNNNNSNSKNNSSDSESEQEQSNNNKSEQEDQQANQHQSSANKSQKREQRQYEQSQNLILENKRLRKVNKFYNDSAMTVYNPLKNFDEEQQVKSKKRGPKAKNIQKSNSNENKKRKRKSNEADQFINLDEQQQQQHQQGQQYLAGFVPSETPPKKKKNKLAQKLLEQQQQYQLLPQNTMPNLSYIQTITTISPGKNRKKQIVDVQLLYDDDQEYCICRSREHAQFQKFLQCDSCLEWFHYECIGIKAAVAKSINEYMCMGCCKRFNQVYLKDQESNFFWNFYLKITWEQFQDLIKEGKQIPIQLDQIHDLQEIEDQILDWLKNGEEILKNGASIEILYNIYKTSFQPMFQKDHNLKEIEEKQEKKDNDLLKFYFKQFKFPVELAFTDQILLLMQKRDFARLLLTQQFRPDKKQFKFLEILLKQDILYLDIDKITENEKFLKQIYCNLIDIYEKSKSMNEKIESLVQNKMEVSLLNNLLKQADDENLLIDKIEFFKQEQKDFQKWEYKVQSIFNGKTKANLDSLQQYRNQQDKFIIINNQYRQKLDDLYEAGLRWENQASKYLQDQNQNLKEESFLQLMIEQQKLSISLELRYKQQIVQKYNSHKPNEYSKENIENILKQFKENHFPQQQQQQQQQQFSQIQQIQRSSSQNSNNQQQQQQSQQGKIKSQQSQQSTYEKQIQSQSQNLKFNSEEKEKKNFSEEKYKKNSSDNTSNNQQQ